MWIETATPWIWQYCLRTFIQLNNWMWIETVSGEMNSSRLLAFIQYNNWMWIETSLRVEDTLIADFIQSM